MKTDLSSKEAVAATTNVTSDDFDELASTALVELGELGELFAQLAIAAPAIAETLERAAARLPRSSHQTADDPLGEWAPAAVLGSGRPPELVIDRETLEWWGRSSTRRVRVIATDTAASQELTRSRPSSVTPASLTPLATQPDFAQLAARATEPARPQAANEPRPPSGSPPPYYSLDHLPPLTSERAFRRHLKAGLPVTRVGYAEVVTPAAWLAWLGSQAKPRASAARAALPPAPTDDELLATVGAKPGSKR
jgi:hypothetical protein